jgi:hypothetical protein
MRCKNTNDTYQNVMWRYVKKAWVAASTVCSQRLYTPTPITTPADTSAPTVTTDTIDPQYSMNMTVSGTITDQGSSAVTEYGWVWSYAESPTISDNKVVAGTGSFSGAFSETSDPGSMDPGEIIYVRAYATNAVGTSYGSQLDGEVYLCFVEGTAVTLANGDVKPIEDITYDDSLLVWNFDEGRFDAAAPLWICHPFELPNHRMMRFSNGSGLSVASFDKGHRIFNAQKNSFTNLNTEDTPFGTESLTDTGEPVYLVDGELIEKRAMFYNVITVRHINMFANGILTSCKLNNIYPIENMRFVKDDRELRDISEFNVPEAIFDGLRLAEQPDYVGLKQKAKTIANSRSLRIAELCY